jgi:class 3 adenylate cyclase
VGLKEDLEAYAKKTHEEQWTTTNGQTVPEVDGLGLGNKAVKLDGTVLYADLAESTNLVAGYKDWFATEVYKNYLYAASRVIRARAGEITAFDGDRVMAVFIGNSKNTNAAKCALQINWVVREILQPAIKAKYPKTDYVYKQKVGVDSSPLLVARTGIRGSNDLVWVGKAANSAAKMAALSSDYPSYISADVHGLLNESSKMGGDPKRNMWTDLGTADVGYRIYGSTWWWSV